MKRIATLSLVFLFIFALVTGCAGSTSSSAVGTYVTKSVNGVAVDDYFKQELGDDINDMLETLGIESFSEFLVMELKADGTAVITSMAEDPETASWKQEGNKLIITADGEPQDCTINGNEITIGLEGEQIVLIKK
ncbi:MAG: hypothetical protein IJK34_04200 [Clostridia bacterium]|nr:hypothetical protein [Clostridia bacterium]